MFVSLLLLLYEHANTGDWRSVRRTATFANTSFNEMISNILPVVNVNPIIGNRRFGQIKKNFHHLFRSKYRQGLFN